VCPGAVVVEGAGEVGIEGACFGGTLDGGDEMLDDDDSDDDEAREEDDDEEDEEDEVAAAGTTAFCGRNPPTVVEGGTKCTPVAPVDPRFGLGAKPLSGVAGGVGWGVRFTMITCGATVVGGVKEGRWIIGTVIVCFSSSAGCAEGETPRRGGGCPVVPGGRISHMILPMERISFRLVCFIWLSLISVRMPLGAARTLAVSDGDGEAASEGARDAVPRDSDTIDQMSRR
jgi:hypothetical protein